MNITFDRSVDFDGTGVEVRASSKVLRQSESAGRSILLDRRNDERNFVYTVQFMSSLAISKATDYQVN